MAYVWLKSVPMLGCLYGVLFIPLYGPGYLAYFGAAEWLDYHREWPFIAANAV